MSRSLSYTVADAFTERVFSGNPAAVILLSDDSLDAQTMQLIAREFNLSETAFISGLEDVGEGTLQDDGSKSVVLGLRWFTPREEVPICGHGTLAAAHVLFSSSPSVIPVDVALVQFRTLSGILTATKVTDGGKSKIQLEFPAGLTTPADFALMARVKRIVANALGNVGHEVVYVGLGSGLSYKQYMLIELAAPFDLAGATVNDGAFLELAPGHTCIMLTTAPPASPSPHADSDYVSRVFAPHSGIPEDPVTGSAQCVLGPYWHLKRHGGRASAQSLHAKQVSERGGIMDVIWDQEKGKCRLVGEAVTSREGTLFH